MDAPLRARDGCPLSRDGERASVTAGPSGPFRHSRVVKSPGRRTRPPEGGAPGPGCGHQITDGQAT